MRKFVRGQFHDFSDVFITINRHKWKWKFSRGPTPEIWKNKTTTNITTYTVLPLILKVLGKSVGG